MKLSTLPFAPAVMIVNNRRSVKKAVLIISLTLFTTLAGLAQANYALSFDGIDDNVTIANNVTATFTLEARIKMMANSKTGTGAWEGSGIFFSDINGPGKDFAFSILNNKLAFDDGNSGTPTTIGTKPLNDGAWHHVAVVRTAGSPGTVKLYVDGAQDGATGVAGSLPLNENPIIGIGGRAGNLFKGYIDEIRVWNGARTIAELAAYQNTSLAGNETNLYEYLKLNEGVGGTASNTVTGKPNGTLNNMVTTAPTTPTVSSGWFLVDCAAFPAPTVTSPVNYCQNVTATPLTATGTNLLWTTGTAPISGSVGGTAILTNPSGNNDITFFATNVANVTIKSIDFSTIAWQNLTGIVLSIYNSIGTVIATSTVSTTTNAENSSRNITNTFNVNIPVAGTYSIGRSGGGQIGAIDDGAPFSLSEATNTVSINSTNPAHWRCYNNIQFIRSGVPIAPTPSTTTAGTTNYYVNQSAGGCTSPAATIAVVVTALPVITAQPVAAAICTGQQQIFSITATGTSLTYQWRKGTVNITGATSATYTITSVAAADAGTYDVVVTGTCNSPVTSSPVVLTVNPIPKITIFADYCAVAGKIKLIATSETAVDINSWKWNTSLPGIENTTTSSSLIIDIVGNYNVTANGCGSPATLAVSNELVVNGDFSSGNSGFTTPALGTGEKYTFKPDVAGNTELHPEGTYSVGTNPNTLHNLFWGKDHTTGTGNLMIINGYDGAQPIVWEEPVAVVPNTTYYFSAWGLSFGSTNSAQLQFKVDGAQLGSIAVLPAGVADNTNNGWTRFYGTWNSGAVATNIKISITDLQTAAGGNDFGLDDISFGTLTTFPSLTSAVLTDQQTVCLGSALTNITYAISTTNNTPVLAGLPAGLSSTWIGHVLTITGTPTNAGTYNYTVSSCNQKTVSGKIIVDAASVGGTFSQPIISTCYNGPATITLSGNVGNIAKWSSSFDGGVSWNDIGKAGISTFTVANFTAAVLYKAEVKNNTCGAVISNPVKVGIRNLWTGDNNSVWNTAKNWSDENVPVMNNTCDDVTIPAVVSPKVYPVLGAGTSTIKNLIINSGASLTLNGTGILQIAGTIANAGTFDVSAGTIEMNGTSFQDITTTAFKNNSILNLIISNTIQLAVASTLPLNLTGTLSFGNAGKTFITNDLLVLKSTASGTARLAAMPVDGAGIATSFITGKVSIERYIPKRRSWRLLSAPIQSTGAPSINAAWQEGAATTSSNPNANFGVHITGGTTANGFDQGVNGNSSLKIYDNNANLLPGLPSTASNPTGTYVPITKYSGYFLFVRGNRSTDISLGVSAPLSETTLRMKGGVNTGKVTVNIPIGKFALVGNPYPSVIDFAKVTMSNLNNKLYLWNSKLTGAYGVGAYVTLIRNGATYDVAPLLGITNSNIASGEAFFVELTDPTMPASIIFEEQHKTTNEGNNVFRPVYGHEKMRVDLLGVYAGGTNYLCDGVLTTYDDANNNEVDRNDAMKFYNVGESICINTDNKDISIERRKTIEDIDTSLLNIYKLAQQNYQLQITAEAMENSGLVAVLKDRYSSTINNTPLNMGGITTINFTVNYDAGSSAVNRFSIVFGKPATALPVTFTSVKASQQQKDIAVEWDTENELTIKEYAVEISSTGINFTKAATVSAKTNNGGSAAYTWLDANVSGGMHYYRIKSTELNGKENYSSIVKVNTGTGAGGIAVYPNPVTDGVIKLQLTNMAAGQYTMRLLNTTGQVLKVKEFKHAGGNAPVQMNISKYITRGMYNLEVTAPNKGKTSISVVVQ